MLTITKYHKHICYRKDGNRLGKRKEQIVLAKELERSMLKHKINSYAGTVYGGPLDASKCASIGVGSDTVYRGMFGNNNHIHSSIGSMGTSIITIDGIPYNSMDEFDRPVSDKDKAQYMDLQFNARKAYKAEYRLEEGTNTYKPLEGAMLKPNKAEDRIQIVTSSMENVIPLKDRMIKERFGINCKIIHSIFGKFKKHHFTKNTFLIEDCVGNVRDHYMHNQNHGIVFNHMNLKYIKKECDAEGFTHTTTYGELIEYVKRYLSSMGII